MRYPPTVLTTSTGNNVALTSSTYDWRVEDLDDLLDAGEVAAVLGLTNRRGVSVYRRRYDDFPEPVIDRAPCVLWRRADLEAWADQRGGTR
jgi:hypothetical protein